LACAGTDVALAVNLNEEAGVFGSRAVYPRATRRLSIQLSHKFVKNCVLATGALEIKNTFHEGVFKREE